MGGSEYMHFFTLITIAKMRDVLREGSWKQTNWCYSVSAFHAYAATKGRVGGRRSCAEPSLSVGSRFTITFCATFTSTQRCPSVCL